MSQQQPQQLGHEKGLNSATDVPSDATLKKKEKKKSHLLVRKLNFNKFRLSSGQQEATLRRSPEDDNGSRSQSQSSQESPVHSPIRVTAKKAFGNDDILEGEKEATGESRKPEVLGLEKPCKIVTVVQRKSPSLIIKSFGKIDEPNKPGMP